MSVRPPLVHPIRAQVGKDGRLLSADEPLLRAHFQAGGEEHGPLAIPALSNLVTLTATTGARLSRAVRFAGIDEDIDAWVETTSEAGIVTLAIVSWRAHPVREAKVSSSVGGFVEAGVTNSFHIKFNDSLILIVTQGTLPAGFDRSYFGRVLFDVVSAANRDQARFEDAVNRYARFVLDGAVVAGVSGLFDIIATPLYSFDGMFDGYDCEFHPCSDVIASVPKTLDDPGLFGQKLAPALRQPLGRIIANAETIGGKLHGPIRENYASYAKDIADAARHLSSLVDDLGDMEVIERPDFTTARDTIELGDIARRVGGLLALKAADHHIKLHLPNAEHNVPAVAEFRRVLQIMINLVTNAIRYSPDGSEIYVTIASDADKAIIMVSDQGAGIAPEYREKIFEKFERLGRSGDGGSGLGLYISRRLARFMGGDLIVGTSEFGGARFTLHLPNC